MGNDIYKMELFESIDLGDGECIKRLPGGWVYESHWQSREGDWRCNSTFIPFSDEFQTKEKKTTKKPRELPSNFDQCFEHIWAIKGKRGAKQKAKEKYKLLAMGESKEDLDTFTNCLVEDISSKIVSDEIGFRELHLTSYLNQKRWES